MSKKDDLTDLEMVLAGILAIIMVVLGFVLAVAFLGGLGLVLFWASNTIFGTSIPISWATFLAAGLGSSALKILLFRGKKSK